MKHARYLIGMIALLPTLAFAWQWMDMWQAVSRYRSSDYAKAYAMFNGIKTSDGQYNAGNAAAFMGKYQDAIAAYDKAIALNSQNNDAIFNRDIVKKLLQQQQDQQQNQQQNQQSNQSNSKQKQSQNQAQNNQQKNQQPNNSQQQNNAQDQSQKSPSQQKSQQQITADNHQNAVDGKQPRQDENSQQLLRRLTDDPGGLLQQKFLRDYARRHGVEFNSDQGADS